MIAKINATLAWIGVALVIVTCLTPVLFHWSAAVMVPHGGVEPLVQMGLLEWSARHWHDPATWIQVPIFFPVSGVVGLGDGMMGQAVLLAPLRALFHPTVSAQYNAAILLSLLLAALGMASLWLACGGGRRAAGVAALALLGAPYTLAQLGHLSQLPPPFLLFSLAALVAALRRHEAGRDALVYWWLLAGSLALQAMWSWTGLTMAVLGVLVLLGSWIWRRLLKTAAEPNPRKFLLPVAAQALVPLLLATWTVLILAQPQLQLAPDYQEQIRQEQTAKLETVTLRNFFDLGAYRSSSRDWFGPDLTGLARHAGRDRRVLHPGWITLALAVVGLWRRRKLGADTARFGLGLLLVGVVGLVLAGAAKWLVPGLLQAWPLPLAWREPWVYSFLGVVAVAWWAAVGLSQIKISGPTWLTQGLQATVLGLLVLVSLPAGVPTVPIPLDGRLNPGTSDLTGPVLTLPAPNGRQFEDQAEALWLTRALETGQPVTSGVSGWVPPETRSLRETLHACEMGQADPVAVLARMKVLGCTRAEIVLRPGDQERTRFWYQALSSIGAERDEPWARPGYLMFRLP